MEDAARDKMVENHTIQITACILMLCNQWDLQLPLPASNESPHSRKARGPTDASHCVARIRYLQYKDSLFLTDTTTKFRKEAERLYTNWVHKPKAERIVPKATRSNPRPLTENERKELVKCLRKHLDQAYEVASKNTPSRLSFSQRLNDDPIPSPRLPRMKRTSNDGFEDISTAKKQKAVVLPKAMPPPPSRRASPPQSRRTQVNAETSFISTVSTVFSRPPSLYASDTQTTIPDEEEIPTQPNSPRVQPQDSPRTQHQDSNYGSSSFDVDAYLHAERSFEVHDQSLFNSAKGDPELSDLCRKLETTFPKIPTNLQHLPAPMLYELCRVELHTGVSMSQFGDPKCSRTIGYKSFWSRLRNHHALPANSLPAMSEEEAWICAFNETRETGRTVIFSGTLCYDNDSERIFRFRLEPLKIDKSHRLDRSLGSHRFFELDIPFLSGGKTTSPLEQYGAEATAVFLSWLIDCSHKLFGREWRPFHLKPKERRGRKWQRAQSSEDFDTGHRIYMFATNGNGIKPDLRMDVSELLDYIRPTAENINEKYLKLFARTDLALSRNTATLVFQREQIEYIQDIKNGKEVMTDGAGQISLQAARLIAASLNLSFLPCAFQARIGEAKGLWSIDHQETDEVWIKITDLQRKWKIPVDAEKRDRECYRTFEVLRYSSPLKPADLNMQFLPILRERARDAALMTNALKALMRSGLESSLADLEKAISTPQTCRAWLKRSGNEERIKYQAIRYRAGLPTTIQERLICLLDGGFDPREQVFVGDLLQKIFKAECEDLRKRLNITLNKSTYAYMVPDFTGTLKEGEVFLNFSNFTDKSSGIHNARPLLNDIDILVARSPAHYASDIQRVRAVFKVELMHLVDVIVFSTKGSCLAAKLSGGDYDGDIAWTCWEPSIVENFVNAEVPNPPDLVAEGLMGRDEVKFSALGKDDVTSIYLNSAFGFNMQTKMLGMCTNFKEEFCYTVQTVSTPAAVYLSTLLSNLVDQAKQGFVFTQEHWNEFKSKIMRGVKIRKPAYKGDHISHRSRDITDEISLEADSVVEKTRTKVYELIGKDAEQWDPDLVKMYEHARQMAKRGESNEPNLYKPVLDQLLKELKDLKNEWNGSFHGSDDDNSKFLAKIDMFHERLCAIRPSVDNALTQSLLPDYIDEALTPWALLRASALYALHPRYKHKDSSAFLWNLVGRQLVKLKADALGITHTIVPAMYCILKPDAAMAKHTIKEQEVDDNLSIVNADELADLED